MDEDLSIAEAFQIIEALSADFLIIDLRYPVDEENNEPYEKWVDRLNVLIQQTYIALRLVVSERSSESLKNGIAKIDELRRLFDDYCQMKSGFLPENEEKLYDVIEQSREYLLRILSFDFDIDEPNTSADVQKPELPGSRPAPIQVEIRESILQLVNEQTRIGSIDYPSANRTRESLHGVLKDVMEDLVSRSNVERAYIRLCERMLSCLATPIEELNIEHLGLTSQLLEKSTQKRVDEIGEILVEQIEHVLANVTVLLNQFDQWQDFLNEQAKTKLNPADGEGLVIQGKALIAELEKPGVPVEPALIERLQAMIEPVVTGVVSADTVAISLVCSYSNIFSTLSQFAFDHYQAVVANPAHAAVAGGVAILLKFSVDLIEKFSPVFAKYQPLAFIIKAVKYLSSLYSQIKDASS